METIVFLDRSSIAETVVLNRPSVAHQWVEYQTTTVEQLVERLQGATVIISNKVPISAKLLDTAGLKKVKMIAVAATGYDNIDTLACQQRGIAVYNVQGYAVNTVPEHAFSLMLALRRQLAGFADDLQQGLWQQSPTFCLFSRPVYDLHGSTLGVVGSGVIGSRVATIASAFGMRVLRAEHPGASNIREGYTPFTEVLQQSDILSLHCPLNEQTRGLIGAEELAQMKPNSLLINTARGGVINEAALIEALNNGTIAGAGLDCLSEEPASLDHPMMQLLGSKNLIITPHMGWASQQAMETLWQQVIDNIDGYFAGNALHRVV